MGNPWYLNPAWYALSLAVLSIAVALRGYILARTSLRSQIQRGLIQQAVAINESLIRHNVRGPYASFLAIPDADLHAFSAKALVFLNHVNLLHDVFQHRVQLGPRVVAAYAKWASTIVRPWLEADRELLAVWDLLHRSRDLFGAEFTQWLTELIPTITVQPVIRSQPPHSMKTPSPTLSVPSAEILPNPSMQPTGSAGG